jgi:hypothetical protein
MDPLLAQLKERDEDWNALNYLDLLYPGGDLNTLVNDPQVMAQLPPELTDRSLVGLLARERRITISQAAEEIDLFL